MIQTGLSFYSRPTSIITVLKQYNEKFYLVEDRNIITGDTRSDILLTPEAIQNDLNNQEEIKQRINRALEYDKRQKEAEQQEKQQEEKEKQEYENVYGYCDKMTPYQKGKVLKVLNKEERYKGKISKRKDFIKSKLAEGWNIDIENNVNYWTRNGIKQKDTCYYVKNGKENITLSITKTEYDYGMYLLENVLQTV
jgi:hypothetical protein